MLRLILTAEAAPCNHVVTWHDWLMTTTHSAKWLQPWVWSWNCAPCPFLTSGNLVAGKLFTNPLVSSHKMSTGRNCDRKQVATIQSNEFHSGVPRWHCPSPTSCACAHSCWCWNRRHRWHHRCGRWWGCMSHWQRQWSRIHWCWRWCWCRRRVRHRIRWWRRYHHPIIIISVSIVCGTHRPKRTKPWEKAAYRYHRTTW